MVPLSTEVKGGLVKKITATNKQERHEDLQSGRRQRIRSAAFAVFMERGYEGASTLEIATRAKVSKRELYALFGNKQSILAACIAERARRMRLPLELPAASNRKALAITLTSFGSAVLRELCDPTVTALYRLAVAEADRSPEVAKALDTAGRETTRKALTDLLSRAQSSGLLRAGEPSEMAGKFFALLFRDLLLRLLLRVTKPPTPNEIKRRARDAAETLLALHASRETTHSIDRATQRSAQRT